VNVVRRRPPDPRTVPQAPTQSNAALPDFASRLERLAREMVSALVDRPDDVRIVTLVGDRSVNMEVHAHPSDVGAMLGRGGCNAHSMRTIMTAAGAVAGTRLMIHFLED
jgi:predicted RNA-binding protein YlqC (UPF0109 family)